MKKLLIFGFILLLAGSCVTKKQLSRSIPDLYFGTGPNTGTGESLNSAMHKIQLLIDEANRLGLTEDETTALERNILHGLDLNVVYIGDIAIMTAQVDADLTDNTPSDADITAALGMTAVVAGKNYTRIIKDTNGSGLVYLVISDGTVWQYIKLTIAT